MSRVGVARKLTIIFVLVALLPSAIPRSAERSEGSGRKAHAFELEDINPLSETHGKRLALDDLHAERGVILNFIASWCKPCWMEIPQLEILDREGPLPVIYVAADEYGPTSDLIRLAGNAKATRPILHVPRASIETMEQHYDHHMLPATYVLDREGRILRVYQGQLNEQDLLELRNWKDPAPATRHSASK